MPEIIPAHHLYCDEAYLQHEFRVQGGVWVHSDSIRAIKREFAGIRQRHPWLREVKWTGVTGSFAHAAYWDVLNLFFDERFADDICFNCIVVKADEDPTHGADAATRDLGFRKAYWTLLRYRLLDDASYHIVLDQKACKTVNPDGTLRDTLNRHLYGFRGHLAVLSCKSVSSTSDDMLQLADLLCGAVGWAWNGRPSKSEAKRTFADAIVAQRNGRGLEWESPKGDSKFNIWRYRPRQTS